MSDRRRARLVAIVVSLCLAVECIVLAWPEAKTEADGRIGRGMSGEIAGRTTLAQRFTVTAPGLRSLTFYAHPAGASVSGPVDLELVELRRVDTRLIDDRRVPATDVIAGPRYTYRFRFLPDSKERTYLLTIAMPDAEPGHGIFVELMKHEYPGNPPNTLYFAGRPRYGSLRFTTEIDRRTLLVRTAAHLSKGPFGRLTSPVLVVLWIGLHALGMRAVTSMRGAHAR